MRAVQLGQVEEELVVLALGSRRGGCGAMLMALSRVSLLFLAGQTSTHRLQPVQSSGATWTVYFMPARSRLL